MQHPTQPEVSVAMQAGCKELWPAEKVFKTSKDGGSTPPWVAHGSSAQTNLRSVVPVVNSSSY